MYNWLLPEYIADILPATARQVESAKAAMLELFRTSGYELVMPPLVEYTDALASEEDRTLAMKMFKLDDPFSGRQLGLRADITPQVARIDAHLLAERAGVTRLCYAGSVVHSRPIGVTSSREPLQLGAELYGYAGVEADLEIIELMLATLPLGGVTCVRLDFGHIGIYRALAAAANLTTEISNELFAALQVKDGSTVAELVIDVIEPYRSAFLALPELYGPISVLAKARRILPLLPGIERAISELDTLVLALQEQEGVELGVDLAELRGDLYHTGLMFAVYAPHWSSALARGGRYDNVGRRFGRSRPATGFSLDLRDLLAVLPERSSLKGIRVAARDRDAARAKIAALRQDGHIVIIDYLQESAHALNCDRELRCIQGDWHVLPLNGI